MSTATHSDAPHVTRDRHENLALAGGHELGGQSITSQADNRIFMNDLKTRTDMATPESKGFPSAHEVMHGMDSPVAKADKSSVADRSPSPSPEALLATAPAATAEKPSKTEDTVDKAHSTEVIGERKVVSTLGTDTAITQGVDTTTYGSKTMDIADSRGSAPVDQPIQQQQQVQEPRLAPRTDIVG